MLHLSQSSIKISIKSRMKTRMKLKYFFPIGILVIIGLYYINSFQEKIVYVSETDAMGEHSFVNHLETLNSDESIAMLGGSKSADSGGQLETQSSISDSLEYKHLIKSELKIVHMLLSQNQSKSDNELFELIERELEELSDHRIDGIMSSVISSCYECLDDLLRSYRSLFQDESFIRKIFNRETSRGETALNFAVNSDAVDFVATLLSNGANPNHLSNRAGWSLLHESFRHGRVSVAQKLIDYGANIHVSDFRGRNILHVIGIEGHETSTEWLKEVLASQEFKAKAVELAELADERGLTPFDYAKKYQHTELIKLLESL